MSVAASWVLFDAVGTLIYPDPPVAQAYCDAGRQFGCRLELDEIGRRFRQAFAAEIGPAGEFHRPVTSESLERVRWQRVVAAVFCELPALDQYRLFESLWNHFALPQHWQLFADVEPAIRRLKSVGLRLGIAS